MLDSLDNKTSPSEQEEQLLQRAQRAERQLAELLANIPAGYATLDRNWTFTFATSRLCAAAVSGPKTSWARISGRSGRNLSARNLNSNFDE